MVRRGGEPATASRERLPLARLTFGIKTAPQDVTYEEILTVWREADAIESFEHA